MCSSESRDLERGYIILSMNKDSTVQYSTVQHSTVMAQLPPKNSKPLSIFVEKEWRLVG